jgi:hypothetical protein
MTETLDLTAAIFSKTPAGQQEIQSRALGLAPLVRRILVLVDGKRSGRDLSAFVSGSDDIEQILGALLSQGCVAAEVPSKAAVPAAKAAAPAAPAVSAASETAAPAADALLGLPAAETRTAKDNDMARNFMINSINSIIGQQMRVSLIHDIFHAGSTEALRTVYHAWAASMAGHGMGSKRLPELREKLFKVL